MRTGVRLFIGGHAHTVQGRPCRIDGSRCFTPVHAPPKHVDPDATNFLLDSGAFSDSPETRPTFEGALARQLAWEERAAEAWGKPALAEAVVSRDTLIDEKWINGVRNKQRWSVSEADMAVRTTIDAAAYLSSQRDRIAPRKLVLATQGVDCQQYRECVAGVLEYACPGDWIGLGGFCILGAWKSWIPTFWETMRTCLPLIAAHGIGHVHIFGVLYRPVLGGLLWLADQHGLTVSTDSSGPVLQVTWPGAKKSGRKADTWEENVVWWREALANLRTSEHYAEPPDVPVGRQLVFWG